MINVNNGELQASDFTLKSSYSREISTHFASLNDDERTAALSSLIEVGWVSIKVGQNRGDFDYWERLTKEWIEGLSSNLIDSNEELLKNFKEEITFNILEFKNKVQLNEVAKDTAEALADRTTLKGLTFEDEVHAILADLASLRNGEVEAVGLYPGLSSSKKGDFTYKDELTSCLISIEAKDLNSKISAGKIDEILMESIQNRGASVGIFVVRNSSCLPEYFKEFHVGKKYITCTVNHLRIAVSVASLLAPDLSKRSSDFADISAFIEHIKSELAMIDEIVKSANAGKKSIVKAISLSQSLKENLEMRVECFTKGANNE
ncbi:hypothetical protein [Bdellovibrio sp. KM01]|uniref:hypothetical protein n=1 Tax=Bdellovibrio sp. KM01 TaxID=2748865 RepID=UPI0015EAE4BA|nr:hypothetical protein [Bdellovibrio sp. KM01]QLY24891.1 hypothetical protein HW988_15885 [Bdellovibrio sp. KM01]